MQQHGQKRDLNHAASEWTFAMVFQDYLNRVALADGEKDPTETRLINEMIHQIHRIKGWFIPKRIDTETWKLRVSRGELPLILNTIKSLQIKHKQTHGTYVAFDEQPPRGNSLQPRPWQPELKTETHAFPLKINTPIRGSYWVSTNEEGGFKAFGVIDSDGDGGSATYMATAGTSPLPLTALNIY